MDRLEKSNVNNNGFIKSVFPFDDDQKALLLNIIQYTVLAIIPVVSVLKIIKNYVPEVDDEKASLMILLEVIGQSSFMFIALYFINKMVCYVPTYSEKTYGDINVINIIPSILLISITMQSKLGDKVQILVDRLWDLYEGQTGSKHMPQNNKGHVQNSGQVRITQPLSQQYMGNPNIDLPEQLQPQMTSMKSQTNEYSVNQQASHSPQSNGPDFNSMYAGPQNPLVNASIPSMEPMAANDFMGGSFGTTF
jgi:hypothetical protein